MKQWLFVLIGSFSLLQHSAEAAPTCQALNVYSDQMKLSQLQKTMTIEIRELHKEKYQITRDFHRTRLDMMVNFIEGKHSRSMVRDIINTTHDDRMTQDHELKISIFELLESFSDEQKKQLTDNLSSQQQCLENNLKQLQKNRPKIGKILFQELELSAAQEDLILEMYLDRRDSAAAPAQYGLHHEDLVLGYLDGEIDERSSEWLFENKAAYRGAFRQDEIDAMMDLLESFSPAQKSQFIQNIEEIKRR